MNIETLYKIPAEARSAVRVTAGFMAASAGKHLGLDALGKQPEATDCLGPVMGAALIFQAVVDMAREACGMPPSDNYGRDMTNSITALLELMKEATPAELAAAKGHMEAGTTPPTITDIIFKESN